MNETKAKLYRGITYEEAVAIILIFHRDWNKELAGYQLMKAWDNSDHASYREVLKHEFGIEINLLDK